MPRIFKIGGYIVYFWINESDPLEPVHVHVCEGVPSPTATKIWITKNGGCLLCHNKSKIPDFTPTAKVSQQREPIPIFVASEQGLDTSA